MENAFVTLAVPGTIGVGAPSDISGLTVSPSMVVEGPESSTGAIAIEISEDGSNFSPATSVFPIDNPPVTILKGIIGQSARVRRLTGTGAAFVALGSMATEENLFVTLSKMEIDTSELGPHKTIVVVGEYDDQVIVEGSNDGTNFDVVATFNTKNTDLKTIYGSYSSMRLKAESDTPTSVAVGGGVDVPTAPTPEFIAEELAINDTPLDAGVLVKMHGDNQYNNARADSDNSGFVGITLEDSVAPPGTVPVCTDGRCPVPILMEAGITPAPAAGDDIYLSPIVFGHGTTIKPKSKGQMNVPVGQVKDASGYADGQTVIADISVGERLPAGPAAGYLSYGFFYNQITGAETVVLGAAVPFPTVGPTGGEVAKSTDTEFLLPWKGVYEISWDVTFNEASQLALQLKESAGAYATVNGGICTAPAVNSRNTKTVIVESAGDNALIRLLNPAGNAGTLTLTPASVALAQTPVVTLSINRIA